MSNGNMTMSSMGDHSARMGPGSAQSSGNDHQEMAGHRHSNSESTGGINPTPSNAPSPMGNDDADIQEYMNRLLSRTAAPAQPAKTESVPAEAPKPVAESTVADQPAPASTSPWNPDEYVPKAVAPEKATNLKALREVAISSSRAAVQASIRKKLKDKSATDGLQAMIAIVFTVLLMIASQRAFDVPMMLGLICFILALLPLVRMVRHIRKANALTQSGPAVEAPKAN